MNQTLQKLFQDRLDQQRLSLYVDVLRRDEDPIALAPYTDKHSISIIMNMK